MANGRRDIGKRAAQQKARVLSPGKPRSVVVCQFRWDPRSVPVRRGMGALATETKSEP